MNVRTLVLQAGTDGFYFNGIEGVITMFDFSGITTEWWKVVLLFVIVIAIGAAAGIANALYERKKGIVRTTGTRELTYGAVCLAASFALSFVGLYKMPSGGTVTLASVLPIGLYCYFFGFRKSLVVCFAYMLLQFFQNPYIISPWSGLFDYVLPYLSISLIGLFPYDPKRYDKVLADGKTPVKAHLRIFIGFALYFVVRYLSHVLAGVLFWSSGIDFMIWHGDLAGFAALGYSLTYNVLFLLPDTLIAVAVAAVLLCNKAFNAIVASTFNGKNKADGSAKNDEGTAA